jgi:ABC-type multidrug transport system ATPase subunit
LELFATFKGVKEDEKESIIRQMILDVDLGDKADELSKNLSGGQ